MRAAADDVAGTAGVPGVASIAGVAGVAGVGRRRGRGWRFCRRGVGRLRTAAKV